MIKLVMLDFDGVLVNSNGMWAEALTKASKEAGIERDFTKESLKPYCGRPYEEVIVGFNPDLKGDEHALRDIYDNLVRLAGSEGFMRGMCVIEGVRETLEDVKGAHRVAICSGNSRRLLEKFIERLGLGGYIDLMVSNDDVSKGKPDPEMLLKALGHFGVRPEEAVYVGDAEADVKAAKAAGVVSVVVMTGALTREDAEKLGPDHIIESCASLREVI